jgi:hypothetical protein
MASLNGQTIASSYEQLLHTDTDGGGNGNTLVSIKDGDNGTTFGLKLATNKVEIIPGSDDANAFEVSQADGTAVFTVNSSTPSATLAGTLTATKALSSDTQTTPETILTLGAKYSSTGADGGAGSGSRIEFQIPDDGTNPKTGTAIAGIKESADDSDSSAGMAFYVSQNDTTLDEVVRIDHDGKVGINTVNPVRPLSVSYGAAKTSTSTAYAMSIQSNESSGQAALQVYAVGGASAAARKWQLQTTEVGVANAGEIELQPDGGKVTSKGIYFTGNSLDGNDTGISSSGDGGDLRYYVNGTNHMTLSESSSNAFLNINQNDTGSAGSTLKQLSLGASNTTIMDFTNIGTMVGAIISNSSNDQNTGCAVVFSHRASSSGVSYIASRNEGSDASSLHFGTRGSGGVEEEFRIDKDGNLTATDTSIGTLSDKRMKEEIADYTGGLDIIKNLKPRTFKWKKNTKAHNAGKTETRRGFVAQEILEADDYYVREQEVQENETGYEYIKDTGKMYTAKLNDKDAMYISAIQSLLKRIEALENA